jgi:hypothetical protein
VVVVVVVVIIVVVNIKVKAAESGLPNIRKVSTATDRVDFHNGSTASMEDLNPDSTNPVVIF